jgi:hypothetical protein
MHWSAMKKIRYGVHFPVLIAAVLVFWFAKNLPLHVQISGMDFYQFGLMGVLHATAIVVSLQGWKPARIIAALCFVLLAAILSAATPVLALWTSALSAPLLNKLAGSGSDVIPIFLLGSAIGCSGYWLMVRLFWFESFRPTDWLRTLSLCVVATASCFGLGRVLNANSDGIIVILTVTWWFAFSIGLYWSEEREVRKRLIPVGQKPGLAS